MTEYVLDASVLVLATTEQTERGKDLRRHIAASQCHAPHHVDAEFGNVLRRQELNGSLDAEAASTAFHMARYFIAYRYPHIGALGISAWALRGAITFYDALYVALAESLGVPLLTGDARLARAPKLPCKVEVVS